MVICITYGDDINNILDISPWRAKNRRMSSGSHDPSSRQAALSLFLIGFITFSLLYAVQPLLPSLARRYALGSADSALALSVSTGALAFAIWLCAARASAWDRRRLMLSALLVAAFPSAASAFSANWSELLLCRALMGLCLGAVPAMAMAHVAETAQPGQVAGAMGLYVSGTALGGMTGRVGLGIVADQHGWTVGLLAVSGLSLLGVGIVWRAGFGALRVGLQLRGLSFAGRALPVVAHPDRLDLLLLCLRGHVFGRGGAPGLAPGSAAGAVGVRAGDGAGCARQPVRSPAVVRGGPVPDDGRLLCHARRVFGLGRAGGARGLEGAGHGPVPAGLLHRLQRAGVPGRLGLG